MRRRAYHTLSADRAGDRVPGRAVRRAAGADHRPGVPHRRGRFRSAISPAWRATSIFATRSSIHSRWLRWRCRCSSCWRWGWHDAAPYQAWPRSGVVGLVDPARHFRSGRGPGVAGDPERPRLPQHAAVPPRRHRRTAELADLRDADGTADRHRGGGAVAGHRHRAGDPGRRRAVGAEGIWRGGRRVRRHAVAAFRARHAADCCGRRSRPR